MIVFLLCACLLSSGLGHSLNRTARAGCNPTRSTASGAAAPKGQLCSGQLIFEENFDRLDFSKWSHEVTMWGGGNDEFELYTESDKNSFTKNGHLHLRPSITAHEHGDDFLYHDTIDLGFKCTQPLSNGCRRTGSADHILPPVKSARIHTAGYFSFKYGYIEISAKTPRGDWLWPAIWMLPQYNVYGGWPRSGEIDILESRGNDHLRTGNDDIGSTLCESTLHFGPSPTENAFNRAHFSKRKNERYNNGFHKFGVEWKPDFIKFFYDGEQIGYLRPDTSMWNLGGFHGQNIWANGNKMAPFDQEFYVILNLAVGGAFFPDNVGNKPWTNWSPRSATDFWEKRNQWLSTWPLKENDGDDASLQVDYIRVWAD